jgi:hypothetical protein
VGSKDLTVRYRKLSPIKPYMGNANDPTIQTVAEKNRLNIISFQFPVRVLIAFHSEARISLSKIHLLFTMIKVTAEVPISDPTR